MPRNVRSTASNETGSGEDKFVQSLQDNVQKIRNGHFSGEIERRALENYFAQICGYVPKFGMLSLEEPDKKAMELETRRNQMLEDAFRKVKGAIPMAKGRVIQIPVVREFHFLNYHVRFMKPEPRQEWRNFKE